MAGYLAGTRMGGTKRTWSLNGRGKIPPPASPCSHGGRARSEGEEVILLHPGGVQFHLNGIMECRNYAVNTL